MEEKKKNILKPLMIISILTLVLIVVIIAMIPALKIGEQEENQYYIGDTVTSNGVSITVTSVENAQKYGTFTTTSFNFIIIYFDVMNNSSSTISINPLYCELSMGDVVFDCKGYDYDIYDIVPGGTVSVSMAYETVKKSTEADYVMKFGYGLLHMKEIKINLTNKSM